MAGSGFVYLPLVSVAQLRQGALFAGRFRIQRVIGRGGMGAVYEVVDEPTGERQALKVLAPQLVSDPKHRARFAKEATISAEIQSSHIVRVLDAGVDDQTDTPWLSMELLRGDSLAAFVRAHGRLDDDRAADVLGQVAEALGAAHAAGVIHRDVKPDNIFVVRTPHGALDVKVLDFGIAKLASESVGRTTGALGSPLWMAPEEARKEALTPAVDVWAFGLLAFYVLTGRELWRSAERDSTIAQALNEVLLEPIPNPILRAQGVALPRGFEAWFGACVVRDASLRFQTVRDAWAQLEPILVVPTLPGFIPPPSEVAPPAPRNDPAKRWLVVAGSVSFAIMIFAVAVTSLRRAGEHAVETDSGPLLAPSSTPAPEESVLFGPSSVASAPPVDAGDLVLAEVKACLRTNDLECAHSVLEPVVSGPNPEAYQVQLLYDLCELQVDRDCMARLAKQHPKVDKRAQRERTLSVPGLGSAAPAASGPDVGAQARDLMKTDRPAARTLLETRVFSLKASRGEANLLWIICHDEKDRTCCATIDTLYPHLSH